MTISFMIGLVFFILNFSNSALNKIRYCSPIMALSFFFHPIVGFSCFITFFLLQIVGIGFKKNFLRIMKVGVLSIVLPSLLINLFNSQASIISAKDFIQLYIYDRHPYHYLVSSIVDQKLLFWLAASLILILISIYLKSKKLLFFNCLVLLSFVSCGFLQYLGVEIYEIKLIAKAGPNRYFILLLFTFQIQLLLTYAEYAEIHKRHSVYDRECNQKLLSMHLKKITAKNGRSQTVSFYTLMGLFILCVTIITNKTILEPLDHPNNGKAREIISWIKANTLSTDTFLAIDFDPFLIRVYAQRTIYADEAYPFNEDYFREFSQRYKFFKNFKTYSLRDIACVSEEIQYLVLPNNNISEFNKIDPIFKSLNWRIVSMSDILKITSCNSKYKFSF